MAAHRDGGRVPERSSSKRSKRQLSQSCESTYVYGRLGTAVVVVKRSIKLRSTFFHDQIPRSTSISANEAAAAAFHLLILLCPPLYVHTWYQERLATYLGIDEHMPSALYIYRTEGTRASKDYMMLYSSSINNKNASTKKGGLEFTGKQEHSRGYLAVY